jgi:hypothetical protein
MSTDPIGHQGAVLSHSLDKPITLLSAIRIGLIWAGEYALLSLIEDSPEALKFATIFCAVGALATLEFREWLELRWRRLFILTITVLSLIYLGFISYAVHVAWHRQHVRNELKNIYSASTALTKLRPGSVVDAGEYSAKIRKWEDDSAKWIEENLGIAASDQFLSRSAPSTFATGNSQNPFMYLWNDCPERDAVCYRHQLETDRTNLIAVMGNKAYDD